jgi:CrcB protein
MRLLLVCIGGALGSGARYLTAIWAASALGPAFPYGTLIVNLAGSDVRVMLTTGVMGGFTTYSTFNYETTGYFREGAWMIGMLNVSVTLVGCLAAGFAGLMLARVMFGR